MKYRLLAFTIIELMVTIGIVAVLATMAVPNISKMYNRYVFRREVFDSYDMFLDARNNAISAKNCSTKGTGEAFSESWEIRIVFNESISSPEYKIEMYCWYQDGDSEFIDEVVPQSYECHRSDPDL